MHAKYFSHTRFVSLGLVIVLAGFLFTQVSVGQEQSPPTSASNPLTRPAATPGSSPSVLDTNSPAPRPRENTQDAPITFNDLRSPAASNSSQSVATPAPENSQQPVPERRSGSFSAWDAMPEPPSAGSSPSEPKTSMENQVPDFLAGRNNPSDQQPMNAMDPGQLEHPAWSANATPDFPANASNRRDYPQQPPVDEATRAPSSNWNSQQMPPNRDAGLLPQSVTPDPNPLIPQSVLDSSTTVQPATFTEAVSTTPDRQDPNLQLARDLVQRYSVSDSNQTLPGRPVTLRELLAQTPVEYRKSMVMQYWETAYDWTTLQIAREYDAWLGQISVSGSQAEAVLLNAARMDARNQILAAEIQLAKSQSRLQELSLDRSELPPLPVNLPLIKAYRTHYDWYHQRNMVPSNLIGIDQVLPRTLELVGQRAEATRAALSAMNQSGQAVSQGQLAFGSALEAARLWQETSRKMFGSILQYNRAIADYAMSINRTAQSPEQLVGMLIGNPSGTSKTVEASQSVLNSSYDKNGRTADLRNQPGATRPVSNQPLNNPGFNLNPRSGGSSNASSQPAQVPSSRPASPPMGSPPADNGFRPSTLPSDRNFQSPPASGSSFPANPSGAPGSFQPSRPPSQPFGGGGGRFGGN